MKQRVFWFSFSLCLALVGLFTAGRVVSGGATIPDSRPGNSTVMTDTVPAHIYPSRLHQHSIVSTEHQAIFGANSCVAQGDPFSSWLDPQAELFRYQWRGVADDRTYRYVIKIPPDYPDEVVRVEIFDADSVNQPNNIAGGYEDLVFHTQAAIERGLPVSELLRCTSDRENPCLIDTDERTLGLSLNDINVWWFARVDENRGNGTPPGDGTCGTPNYDPSYNTITYYELSYEEQGEPLPTQLAFYYGQSGDAVVTRNGYPRDLSYSSYNHQTDLRWVAPGGQSSSDQPVVVPAGCGSPNGGDFDAISCPGGSTAGPGSGFEIELDNDMPNAVVDSQGNRYLYLNITSESGASENGYEIWAGPNDYITTYPSDVNLRNVAAIDAGFGHDSLGVEVFASGQNLLNSNINYRVDVSLTHLGPEYVGQSVYVSLFDSDAGADPPITFFFDTIPQEAWSLTFSEPGVDDPDGVPAGTRCLIGDCFTQFIEPPYRLDLPDPFPGGTLMASYQGGQSDTYMWHIEIPAVPAKVALNDIEIIGSNTGQVDNPHTFLATVLPITTTQPITYVWQATGQATVTQTNGLSDSINFTWSDAGQKTITITANNGLGTPVNAVHAITIVQPSLSVLPVCTNGPDIDLTVSGDDWVDSNTPILLYWVEEGEPPALREILPAGHPPDFTREWQLLGVPNGSHRVQAVSGSTIVEAPVQVPCEEGAIQTVTLDGPTAGFVDTIYSYMATVLPISATQPITYVWEATGYASITQTNGLTDTIEFTWSTSGEKTVSVTVSNGVGSPITVMLTVQIESRLWLPVILNKP